MRYVVEYQNDTGPHDDGFWEWYEVTDTETRIVMCKCSNAENAQKICDLLNKNNNEK